MPNFIHKQYLSYYQTTWILFQTISCNKNTYAYAQFALPKNENVTTIRNNYPLPNTKKKEMNRENILALEF
jgi:hypothetical protein